MTCEAEVEILSSLDSGSVSPEVVIVFGDQIAVCVGNDRRLPASHFYFILYLLYDVMITSL